MISILSVAYKNRGGLERTFNSIQSQSVTDVQWIVVDGGSRDGTVEFLESKREWKRNFCFVSESDRGVYDAMNKGLKFVQGKWVIFLNAGDCFASSSALEKIIRFLSNEADVFMFGWRYLDENGKGVAIRHPRDTKCYISYGPPCCHQSAVFSAELFNTFSYELRYKTAADYDLFARLYLNGARFLAFDEVVVDYELGGMSSSRWFSHSLEGYRIQRDVLNVPPVVRYFYFLRKAFTVMVMRWLR